MGFAGATQDIVIDGWRITVAPAERAGLMSSWSEIGWRIGDLVSGAGALYLADAYGWRAAYLCMAACMAPGMIAALMAPEPPSDLKAHVAQGDFVETIVAPIKELLTRLGTFGIPSCCSSPVSACPAMCRARWHSPCSNTCIIRIPISPR